MSSQGGLLELVARGKKDTFFTQNPKISFFHSVYTKSPSFTQEIRYTFPRNKPEWGRWVDFEIESVGDIMKYPLLVIELPSWFPPNESLLNPTSYTTDLSGVEFGYCQDLGALIFEKIQLFNDQLLIHEFWGNWLEWRIATRYKSAVFGAIGGRSPKGRISKSATPPRLGIYLPILGNQTPEDLGLPMMAISNQRLRIRIFLKKLEEIIEASDGRLNPNPWQKVFQQRISPNSEPTEFNTLSKAKIPGPTLTLQTTQVYLPRDAQEYLRHTSLSIPFTQVQLCKFTIEDVKWKPLIDNGATVILPLPLDFIGAVSRLTVGAISDASMKAGQAYITYPLESGSTSYFQSIRLNAGLLDRLNKWPTKVWRDLSNYYKNQQEPIDPLGNVFDIFTLTFGGGDIGRPLGTFNMSRTDEAFLYVELSPIPADSRTNSRKIYIYVFAESWNIYQIKDGKGIVMFAD